MLNEAHSYLDTRAWCHFNVGKVKVEIFFFTLSKLWCNWVTLGVVWCIWGPKAKTDYLVLDTKLLLIYMDHVEFFIILESL